MFEKIFPVFLPISLLLLAGCAAEMAAEAPSDSWPQTADPRLDALWRERARDPQIDFPIGPGDVLEIAVPGLPELEERTVRVGGDGEIELPLLGVVSVAGRSEQGVSEALRRRLEASVMYDPAVSVFVREYRSRIVGVIGAVERPGFHPLASTSDTIFDALALAGGMNENAAARLYFLPAMGPGGRSQPPDVVPASLTDVRSANPILIELSALAAGGSPTHLGLPIRPGDLVYVPERGDVLVTGWVRNPGSHPISPGLTVLGAVTAAGGPRFAAKREAVDLIRSDGDGSKLSRRFDLGKLERGEERDPAVQAGDVIDVSASPPKAVLSGIYEFARSIFHFGFGRTL
jgi:polysaccharide export outer membrane protein